MRHVLAAFLLVALTLACAPAAAQRDFDAVTVTAERISDRLSVLFGAGGNIAVHHGADGAFLVDDQFAPLTPKITAAVAALTKEPIRWVVNTHWHGDHTGGNENLGASGAVIVAHENVRARMSVDQFMVSFGRAVPAAPQAARPVVTFTDAVTFHWNGEAIRVEHVAPAHTDGDSIVRFESSDAVHMGDTYFHGLYPFIDVSSGGRIDGVIAAVERVLPGITETTTVIPGHGPLGKRADLVAYRDMLLGVRAAVRAQLDAGEDEAAIIASKPTAPWDAVWGGGFLSPDKFTEIVIASMK